MSKTGDVPLSVALSGGGHRASLFALGALLYLVDSGGNRNVDSMVSVSGGSITNAYIAQECDFHSVDIKQFDNVASKLLRIIVERGVLFSTWQTGVYIFLLAILGLYLLVETLFDWPANLPWYALILGGVLLFILLSARGILLSWLLSRQLFRREGRVTRLRDLSTSVEHVFCATDLGSGTPFYASTAQGAKLVSAAGSVNGESFRLHVAVRASAAFPGGFPPKRLPRRRYGLGWESRISGIGREFSAIYGPRKTPSRQRVWLSKAARAFVPHALFLSDGGVWNNLATDWVMRARSDHPKPRFLLVVDASAPLASVLLDLLNLPGAAEVAALRRATAILYLNTVDPRIQVLEAQAADALRHSADSGQKRGTGEDADNWILPVVMRITEGRGEILKRYRRIFGDAGREMPEPLIPGNRGYEIVDQVWRRFWDEHRRFRRPNQPGAKWLSSGVGTTLGRIDATTAVLLVAHGYINAMTALHIYCGYPFGPLKGFERFRQLLTDSERDDSPGFVDPDSDVL